MVDDCCGIFIAVKLWHFNLNKMPNVIIEAVEVAPIPDGLFLFILYFYDISDER